MKRPASSIRTATAILIAAFAVACARNPFPNTPGAIPPGLTASTIVITPEDPDYARADVATAVKPAGAGNVSRAVAIRLTQDMTVFRLWNGPWKVDEHGRTNRIGSWWTFDPPRGTAQQYRVTYEICLGWNDLTWVATCTLKKGAVVAIGPGNSVSADTCQDPSGKERYPASPRHWQVYVSRAFERIGPEKELECPGESLDYEADARNLAKPKPGVPVPSSAR